SGGDSEPGPCTIASRAAISASLAASRDPAGPFGSGSMMTADSSGSTSAMIWPTRLRSREASAAASQAPPPRTDRNGSMLRRLLVLLHRGPQAVAVQDLDVAFHRFPGPGGDHRLALVVHVQHQLGGLLLRIAEDVLEHVRHVRHQVDRIVPDDRDPGPVRYRIVC